VCVGGGGGGGGGRGGGVGGGGGWGGGGVISEVHFGLEWLIELKTNWVGEKVDFCRWQGGFV